MRGETSPQKNGQESVPTWSPAEREALIQRWKVCRDFSGPVINKRNKMDLLQVCENTVKNA